MCRLFQRQSGQLQRPCWLRILWASVGVPSRSLYCSCAILRAVQPTTVFLHFRWRGGYDIYIYTCNFWRTLHELQEYIEKIFPLCSRQWPIINIYSNVGFVGCATWWTLYNKVSCLYRPGVQDSVNLYVEKQDWTKLTGPSYFESSWAVGYPKFDLPMFDIRVKSLVVWWGSKI